MIVRLLNRPVAIVAALFGVVVVVACLGASWLAPYGPLDADLSNVLAGPSADHLLGTDTLGRDTLSRLMYGGPPTFLAMAYTIVISLLLGVAAGIASGYWGGRTDWILSRTAEIMMALPGIVVILAVLAVFERNVAVAMIALGVLLSPRIMRVVRSSVLDVRNELYVDAARVSGLRDFTIIRRHIMPRVIGPTTVQAFLMAGTALIAITTLGFLGLDAQPPDPSWGGMVADAGTAFQLQPIYLLFTGGLIAATALAMGILGDSTRDALVADRSESRLTTRRRRPRPANPPAPAAPQANGNHAPLLVVRGLTVNLRDGNRVLDDVSFELHPGETVGVLGESGSGKTLTALSILGLLPAGIEAVSGRCVFAGQDLLGLSERELGKIRGKSIGFVSQEPMASLDPSFTVGSQLVEAIRTHHRVSRSAAKARAVELLTLVKLRSPEELLRRYSFEISGGQAQRVVIALALAGEPDILIADEPTTALDVTVQAEILALLRSIQSERHMSIILVTHNWGVLSDMCDRVVVMYAGQVVEEGSIYDLFERPSHPYTRALLESSPSLSKRGEDLPAIPGVVPKPGSWPTGCHFAPRCSFAVEACEAPVQMSVLDHQRSARCIRIKDVSRVPLRLVGERQ